MNEFVEECRSQWEQLGVPDAVANEMAADLAADLEEAEAEGASAEEVLGSGAFDPRSFATAWAAERGLIQRQPPTGHAFPSRSRTAAAIGAFGLIAVIGAVLVILVAPSTPGRLALASPVGAPLPVALSPDGRTIAVGGYSSIVRLWDVRSGKLVQLPPPPGAVRVASGGIWIPRDDSRVVSLPRLAPAIRSVAVDISDSGVDTRTVGSVLLTVGLAGVVLLAMFWLWFRPAART